MAYGTHKLVWTVRVTVKRHDRVGALLAISLILATVTTLSGCKTLHVPDVNMPKLRWPFSAKPVPPRHPWMK